MSRQTGTVITIVVAVITLCCSSFCCLFGALTLFGGATWSEELGTGEIPPVYGAPVICLGLLVWLVPLLLYLFLVQRQPPAETADYEEIEEI